jgi:hypothetical protein
MNAVLDAFRQAQFSMTDFLRQAQGDAVAHSASIPPNLRSE